MSQFISENGLYVAIKAKLEEYSGAVRNRLLARKLGVRSIKMGKHSYLRGLRHMAIGENFSAGQGSWLEAVIEFEGEKFSPRLIIGENVIIAFWSHIAAVNYVEIGSGVLIGSKVIITDHNHGSYGPEIQSSPEVPPARRFLSRGRVVIRKNVWVGDGVVIAPGADIGEGCVIGANAVVNGFIPPYTIAVGMPARPIKQFDFEKKEWTPLANAGENDR